MVNCTKSEVFQNIAAVHHRKIAYMDLRKQKICLIVRDVFDKDLYYQEFYRDFSPSAVPSIPLKSATFVKDDVLEITYLKGTDYIETKETIECKNTK